MPRAETGKRQPKADCERKQKYFGGKGQKWKQEDWEYMTEKKGRELQGDPDYIKCHKALNMC